MFVKIIVLKKFANFTGKRVGVVYSKVARPQNYNFIKKRLQHWCFPVSFVNYSITSILQRIYERLVLKHQCAVLRPPFFTEHHKRLILAVSGFQPTTLLKKRLRQRCFSVNFAKFLTFFNRTPPDDCFLLFRSSVLQSTSGKPLISYTSSTIPIRALAILQEISGCETVSLVAHYFSNSFQKLAGNEYCSKLEKEFKFQVTYTSITYLIFQGCPYIFEFKVILKLFSKQVQNSGICKTQGLVGTLSIYPMKLQHIEIPDTFKILVYCEPDAYSEYPEFLEYSLHRNLNCLQA